VPNKRFEKFPGKGHKTGVRGKHDDRMPMKTANWAGLPGPTQKKDRSGGDRRVKIHPKSVGI